MEVTFVLIDCIYSKTFKKIQNIPHIRENSSKFRKFTMNTSVVYEITLEFSAILKLSNFKTILAIICIHWWYGFTFAIKFMKPKEGGESVLIYTYVHHSSTFQLGS